MRKFLIIIFILFIGTCLWGQDDPNHILLKNYRPVSIYKIPRTEIKRARFMAVDMHSHPYADGANEISQWVENMDKVGIDKTIILSKMVGAKFDSVYALYSVHGNRFDIWCGIDLSH